MVKYGKIFKIASLVFPKTMPSVDYANGIGLIAKFTVQYPIILIIFFMVRTILLLLFSNIFMTFAWYGHLKQVGVPLWKAILISWGIAFFEYCLMVPANKLGYASSTNKTNNKQEIRNEK